MKWKIYVQTMLQNRRKNVKQYKTKYWHRHQYWPHDIYAICYDDNVLNILAGVHASMMYRNKVI